MDDVYFTKILNWYHENFTETVLTNNDRRPIRYALQKNSSGKGTVIVVSGRTEFLEKYLELCWDFRYTGLSLCVYDHYGQGKSGRMLDDPQKGHIEDFNTYLEDLHNLVIAHVIRQFSPPYFLLTHSMGSTIGTQFAVEYPELVHGLILVSPMFQINTGRFLPPLVVETISRALCFLGGKGSYVPGGGPFRSDLPFENNVLTSDKRRFELNQALMRNGPDIAVGSPTVGWLTQAYQAMRHSRHIGRQLKCPLLLLQGLNDIVVGSSEMKQFCTVTEHCQMISYPEARHELLMEQDVIRSQVLSDIVEFIQSIRIQDES